MLWQQSGSWFDVEHVRNSIPLSLTPFLHTVSDIRDTMTVVTGACSLWDMLCSLYCNQESLINDTECIQPICSVIMQQRFPCACLPRSLPSSAPIMHQRMHWQRVLQQQLQIRAEHTSDIGDCWQNFHIWEDNPPASKHSSLILHFYQHVYFAGCPLSFSHCQCIISISPCA